MKKTAKYLLKYLREQDAKEKAHRYGSIFLSLKWLVNKLVMLFGWGCIFFFFLLGNGSISDDNCESEIELVEFYQGMAEENRDHNYELSDEVFDLSNQLEEATNNCTKEQLIVLFKKAGYLEEGEIIG